MGKRRVGIAGIEHYHTPGWVQSLELFPDDLEIVALYDPNPERGEDLTPTYVDPHLAQRLDERYRGVPFETDFESFLRHDLDLALVTLPNTAAPEAMIRLAEAGVHMLVDKPGAPNAKAMAGVVEAARRNDVRIAAGFLRRYSRGFLQAREMIEQGRTGRLLATESVFVTSSPFVRGIDNPIFGRDLQGGGILLWLGVHDLDQLLWLTGERIVAVQAMSGQVNQSGIEVEDIMSMSLRYESGAIGTAHAAYVLPRTTTEGYIGIRGAKGSVTISVDGSVQWFGGGTAEDPVIEETQSYRTWAVPGYGAMAPAAITDLLAAIDEGRDPGANAQNLLDVLRVVDAAYASAELGNTVDVDWS
jgi:predicted dehydrogenase